MKRGRKLNKTVSERPEGGKRLRRRIKLRGQLY